ncbi:hypothetical protein PISMIDRAFT_117774, partial [Pisolithus microcarpus 441]
LIQRVGAQAHFMSPSSALASGKVRNTHASNAKIHHTAHVEAYHIAYAAVHVSVTVVNTTEPTLFHRHISVSVCKINSPRSMANSHFPSSIIES